MAVSTEDSIAPNIMSFHITIWPKALRRQIAYGIGNWSQRARLSSVPVFTQVCDRKAAFLPLLSFVVDQRVFHSHSTPQTQAHTQIGQCVCSLSKMFLLQKIKKKEAVQTHPIKVFSSSPSIKKVLLRMAGRRGRPYHASPDI